MEELTRFNQLCNELLNDEKPLYAGQMLQRAADKWPDRIAIIYQDEQLSFKQLYYQASAISFYLHDAQVAPDDKVMIFYENSSDFYRAYWGAWQLGAIVIPVNTFLHEKELEHVIKDAQPDVLIVSEQLATRVWQFYPAIKLVVTHQDLQNLRFVEPRAYQAKFRPVQALSVLLYTSGTTGLPKGVMLSSYNCLYNSIQGIVQFSSEPHDRILCSLPLFHSFMQNGCIWSPCLLGAAVIVVPRIDRKALIAGLAHKPTVVVGIPQLFGLFCLMKKISFPYVRFFVSGGDALPDKIRKLFELIFGRKICNGYGLSETSPFISVDLDDTRSQTNTVGKPFVGITCQLRDQAGNIVAGEATGTLFIQGGNVMLGYYQAPQATAHVLSDGWLNTGDLARFNHEGKLVICGREKDLIIHKGIKIYPQEVENCLMLHPVVVAAGVIGVPTGQHDEIPIAYIAARDFQDSKSLVNELNHLCQTHLAGYKIPREFIVLKELPMTSTGKINKKELRILYDEKK